MKFRSFLRRHASNLALVIGNGINRYGAAPETNSWNELLETLAKRFLDVKHGKIPKGIALTEFYDLIDLKSGPSQRGKSLQGKFCGLMEGWKPHAHHKRIVAKAKQFSCPLLTTNFDNVLGEAGDCKLLRTHRDGFTDYYPWGTYYGNELLEDPCAGFGIWHINGMQHYQRSIRLGLTDYMGSVEKARGWLHKGNEKRLFSGKNIQYWQGAGTWLHVIFNKPLVFFGLELDVNEVFLRWLLIERARYFQKFPKRKQEAWYVHTDETDRSGKLFFLNGVGVKPIRVMDYDELYGAETWA